MTSSVEPAAPRDLPLTGGGRHRPFWKLTDDPLIRHAIRRERQERRRSLQRSAMKGIRGSHTTEVPPYPPLAFVGKDREPGQPVGIGGAAKRRRRKGGNPKGGPGGGGVQGAGRRLAEALEARP